LPKVVERVTQDVPVDPLVISQAIETQLRKAEGIKVLPGEAITRLAAAGDTALFGAGEYLIAAGEVPHHVYVITSGEAMGTYPAETGDRGSIRFGANEVLGVTSLSRAQASETQIVAVTDVAVIRMPGDIVARAMQEHPVLGNQFARIWQVRAETLRRSAQQANEVANQPKIDEDATDSAA
jgi:CRP-like cAMP-binding protein